MIDRVRIPTFLCAFLIAFLGLSSFASAQFDACRNFRRGDANSDGGVDLADGVFTLNHLFAGGVEPACADAADADDSGGLELTDAVYTFQWLFVGGAEPPAPGAFACGFDRTVDALGCDSSPPCDPVPVDNDFRGFGTFQFVSQPGLGFCPQIPGVLSATILRVDDEYVATVTLVVEEDAPPEECLPGIFEAECAVARELEPRALTADEVDRMIELFASVETYIEQEPFCECVAIDPCLIRAYGWDDSPRFSEFPCSTLRIGTEDGQAIARFVQSLVP